VKAVAYLRVSTVGQAENGLGLEVQEKAIRTWARAGKHRLVALHRDAGKSGSLPAEERPGLLAALNLIADGKAQTLVVTSLDRLARTLTIQEGILAKVWSQGGRVWTTEGEVPQDDVDDPARTAMRQMAGVFAQLDRAMIAQRLRRGRNAKRERGGRYAGRPPYGYRAEGGELVEDEAEQKALKQIRRLHEEGKSLREIAEALNQRGIRPRGQRKGEPGERWHPYAVSRIIARPALAPKGAS
jgi:DNA invertase Pin-like site-specific DNA recombinase